MIFGIIKTYKDVRRGVNDPTGLGQDIALDVLKAPLILFTIAGIAGLVLFFILGWTELLSGPFGFFKFVFFLLLIPFTILEIVFWSLFNKLKKVIQNAKNRVDERINTIDVEVK
ncbi:MAG: hypothetical protein KA007_03095 [Candidatus Pacebacteria bacterium]|nr:hypothetical protein [Candidatus Paceibacterota bacterium]